MIEQIYSTYLHLCVMKTIITMRMMKMMSSLTSCRHHKSVARILDVLQQSLPTLPSPTAILALVRIMSMHRRRLGCRVLKDHSVTLFVNLKRALVVSCPIVLSFPHTTASERVSECVVLSSCGCLA